jgi:hypothetical protein
MRTMLVLILASVGCYIAIRHGIAASGTICANVQMTPDDFTSGALPEVLALHACARD